jgi:uncharacterized protein (DUF697 family)
VVGIKDISSVWKNIKEIDLKPIRESATRPVMIALAGAEGSGWHSLAEHMRTDPAREGVHTQTPLALLGVDALLEVPDVHLIILLVEASRIDLTIERDLVKKWSEAGKNVLVFINKINQGDNNVIADVLRGWQASRVIYGDANDADFLQAEFVPAILDALPQQQLALGRQFPLFRLNLARQLINEACYSNAAYAFSTGLAEIVPVLDIPLNVTDMMVLTKLQAFLAYKLGLLLGFSTRWQDYVTEFSSVVGSGFLWRQIARQLVGLVPGWGIIPKVAVAYSGTYVVGNAILGWYITGRKLTPQQMRELYAQAFSRGKEYARKLSERIPKPKLRKRRAEKLASLPAELELSPGEIPLNTTLIEQDQEKGSESANKDLLIDNQADSTLSGKQGKKASRKTKKKLTPLKGLRFSLRKKETNVDTGPQRVCPSCGKLSAADARFCQYCGMQLDD